MFFGLPKMLSRSNCILILVMSNLANCAPLQSRKRLPNESEQGFSVSPRILELQLPLKITSKEDLVAWSKYVTSLVTSKINLTSIGLKDASPVDTRHDSKHLSLAGNSVSKSKVSFGDRQQGANHPTRRLKGTPHVQRGDDKVIAYPLPIGGMRTPADPFGVRAASINGPIDQHPHRLGYPYASLNSDNLVQQSRTNVFGNLGTLAQQPAVTYLPQPMRTDVVTYHHQKNTIDENVSRFEEPRTDFQAPSNAFDPRTGSFNGELGQALPIAASNDLTGQMNLSHFGEPLLAFPFQAVITITRQLPTDATTSKTQSNEYFAVRARDPPDEFPPYFEKNYTATSTTGNKISVTFNDITADRSKKKTRKKEQVTTEGNGNEEDERDATRGNKSTSAKRTKSAKKQKSRKRQSTTLVDLLRTLGILRRPPKNATEISVATPILSILKGTNPQKIQVAFDEVSRPD